MAGSQILQTWVARYLFSWHVALGFTVLNCTFDVMGSVFTAATVSYVWYNINWHQLIHFVLHNHVIIDGSGISGVITVWSLSAVQ